MEDIKLETVNKYTVILHPFLTYDQYIDINSLWTKDMKLDPNKVDKEGKPEKPTMGLIGMDLINQAKRMAIGFLVEKILDSKGAEVKREKNQLPIPAKDAKPVIDEIQRLQKEASEAFEGEKK